MSCDDIIDRSAVARLQRLGGDRLVARMIDLFSRTGAARVEEACVAVERRDLPGVELAAHSLKTSAGNVGARALQEVAAGVEALAAAGDTQALAAPLIALRAAHAAAVACLETGTREAVV